MTALPPPCPDLDAYLDGELDARQRTAVEAHVASCPACEDELTLAREMAGALRSLDDCVCPPAVLEAALAQARRVAPDRQPARAARSPRWRLPAYAGVAMAALAVLVLLFRPDATVPAGPAVAVVVPSTPPTPDAPAADAPAADAPAADAPAPERASGPVPVGVPDEAAPAPASPRSTRPAARPMAQPPPSAPDALQAPAPPDLRAAAVPTQADSAAIARDQVYLALSLLAQAQEHVTASIGNEANRLSSTLRSTTVLTP